MLRRRAGAIVAVSSIVGLIGNPDYEIPCWAVFVCGTPLESQAGIGD